MIRDSVDIESDQTVQTAKPAFIRDETHFPNRPEINWVRFRLGFTCPCSPDGDQ
jgi:hypothetical protein